MSKRVTVNLPDDVAGRLDLEPNASAFVTEAVRERMEREQTHTLLADHGLAVTDEGIARARQRRLAAAKLTPERREALRQLGRSA
jgi:predicted transcriptional regulator